MCTYVYMCMYYKCMYIFLHIFKIFTDYLKQFKHFVFFVFLYFIRFLFVSTDAFRCTDLHARRPIRRLNAPTLSSQTQTPNKSAKRSFCGSLSLSLLFLSRSLVQVNLYYFFPTGKRPVLCMPRYEVKCLNYASFESSLLYLLLTHDLCALSPSVYQLVAC